MEDAPAQPAAQTALRRPLADAGQRDAAPYCVGPQVYRRSPRSVQRESGCPGNWAVPRYAQVMACVVARSRKSHGGGSSRLALLRRAGQFKLLRRSVRAGRGRGRDYLRWPSAGAAATAPALDSATARGSCLFFGESRHCLTGERSFGFALG